MLCAQRVTERVRKTKKKEETYVLENAVNQKKKKEEDMEKHILNTRTAEFYCTRVKHYCTKER